MEGFPYWKEVSSMLVASHAIFILLPSLVLNIAIFLTFLLCEELHNPLAVLYGTLLGMAIINGLISILTTGLSVHMMVKDCNCLDYPTEQAFSVAFHQFIYPAMLAGVAIIQLVILRRRSTAISYITVIIVVAVVLASAVPLPFLLIALTDTWAICNKICQEGIFLVNQYSKFLATFIPIQSLLLAATMICYIWSMLLHKNRAINHSEISRKVISYPLLMTLWIAVQGLVYLIPFVLASKRELSIDSHWAMLVLNIPFLLKDISGLALPLLLLRLSNKIRTNLKILLLKYYDRFQLYFNFVLLPIFRDFHQRHTAQVRPARQSPQAKMEDLQQNVETTCTELAA